MAYLRISRTRSGEYYYICQSERRGATVRTKVLEYLGRDPDPKRLKRAFEYWGVKGKPGKGERRPK